MEFHAVRVLKISAELIFADDSVASSLQTTASLVKVLLGEKLEGLGSIKVPLGKALGVLTPIVCHC